MNQTLAKADERLERLEQTLQKVGFYAQSQEVDLSEKQDEASTDSLDDSNVPK